MFDNNKLKEMINLIGDELKREDQKIRDACKKNKIYTKIDGIWTFSPSNEKYLQHVSKIALIEKFPFYVKLEHDYHDIALFEDPGYSKLVALGEMKRYYTPQGKVEGGRIKGDIEKLKKERLDCYKFIIIFTASSNEPNDDINFLLSRLGYVNYPDPNYRNHIFIADNSFDTQIEIKNCNFTVFAFPVTSNNTYKASDVDRCHSITNG